MSNHWDQFFGLRFREHQVLPYPLWTEHYASTVEKPLWLANYKLMHIANQDEQLLTREPVLNSFTESSAEHNAVHALHRAFFKDLKDRHDMLLALEIGHTIAIVENDETKSLFAVGAIVTFIMYTKSNGIVLYLQIHDDFRRSGFGTYLLHLMGMTIVHRSGKDHAGVYLLANDVDNRTSMLFYAKLGFEKFINPNQKGKPVQRPVTVIKKCTSAFNTFSFKRKKMEWFGY